jgi:hypothetical protein
VSSSFVRTHAREAQAPARTTSRSEAHRRLRQSDRSLIPYLGDLGCLQLALGHVLAGGGDVLRSHLAPPATGATLGAGHFQAGHGALKSGAGAQTGRRSRGCAVTACRWSASRMAAPSRRGQDQAGQRLRPAEWSLSRSGLPKTNGPPCHPAMTKISTSAVASLISMRGARKDLRSVQVSVVVRLRSPLQDAYDS